MKKLRMKRGVLLVILLFTATRIFSQELISSAGLEGKWKVVMMNKELFANQLPADSVISKSVMQYVFSKTGSFALYMNGQRKEIRGQHRTWVLNDNTLIIMFKDPSFPNLSYQLTRISPTMIKAVPSEHKEAYLILITQK
jgi:hypothetical protein